MCYATRTEGSGDIKPLCQPAILPAIFSVWDESTTVSLPFRQRNGSTSFTTSCPGICARRKSTGSIRRTDEERRPALPFECLCECIDGALISIPFLLIDNADTTSQAKTPTGRSFFITPRPADPLIPTSGEGLEYPLSQLVVFTEHPDTIRRGGVASTIK